MSIIENETAPLYSPATAQSQGHSLSKRSIFVAMIGNLVEWFDYSVYAFFAVYIGRTFFPSETPLLSLLSALGVFGVGFVARPFGSLVFAHFGDRFGRRKALLVSILMMAGATLLIGLLPGYATIGAAGTVVLVLARLCQGLSGGGAWAGAGLLIVEAAPARHRGFFSSFHQAGVGLGLLFGSLSATLATSYFDPAAMDSYGWRIPFVVGGLLGLVGLLLRGAGHEAPVAATPSGDSPVQIPIVEAWRTHRGAMLAVAGIFLSATVNFYVFLAYLPIYASSVLGMPEQQAFAINTAGLCIFVVGCVVAGALSDRFGRRSMLILHAAGICLLALPLFAYLDASRTIVALMAVQFVGAALQGAFSGSGVVTIVEMFPAKIRYSGVAVPQGLVTAIFGGTAGFIITALVARTGEPIAIVYYIVPAAAVTLITACLIKETYKVDLDTPAE
ncbi:MFS transporter [Sphingobium subterraneum]|uniref:MHS family proline/betaine transporter-like MFS transporter n=1 Tax=Sphingobium subterraneum TaxID=627688 RepID=A0A841J373_9SPHN|nr:MFS transporter [Sphingobium subterraneum]MBB6122958.1 MHS family proline/betaine transporter-like MFS transporter [Sphingobium subterraneum]